jgi:hypothetical protein
LFIEINRRKKYNWHHYISFWTYGKIHPPTSKTGFGQFRTAKDSVGQCKIRQDSTVQCKKMQGSAGKCRTVKESAGL